ncbi:MAG: alpha/beta fold hydrolase [Candidatus Dormibacter sp.]|uniref:alpha/beta fold hydrolase n=1 Tax=Candidatus Dormibacter sp. TaxID=2973982 RepID=UPI000DB2E4DA|nr:MAG: alpha/beta hydrolase [Candidatus Dormibacteraeota bacterium]
MLNKEGFAGFAQHRLRANGVVINALVGGAGAPLLLLHGAPQTHFIWHRMVQRLARDFTVVATDLRGYGDSDKPSGRSDHANYSKRTMAQDQVEVMRLLGFDSFLVVGHDRGGRVGHRMALDHPERVRRLVTLDIAPTLAMYEQTSMEFAKAYFHWFFLIQPVPLPERLIGSDPEFYLNSVLGGRSAALAPFTEPALAEYVRCLREPAAVHAMCEDYRAAASIDLAHDRADRAAGRLIECDTLALWGAEGVVASCFRPLAEWRRVARRVSGAALACGHYIPEEAPEALLAELLAFLPKENE